MVEFDQWSEGFLLMGFWALIVIVPCVLVAWLGSRLIYQLGHHPSRAPKIHMSILFQLIAIECLTFFCFFAFYRMFSGK